VKKIAVKSDWLKILDRLLDELGLNKKMDKCLESRNWTDLSCEHSPRQVTSGKASSFSASAFGIMGKLFALVFVFCAGCTTTKNPTHPLVSETPNFLNAGDVIKITFPGAPELNQTQKVGTDGALTLPLIGEVHAAGKSPGQLQNELATLYKPQLQDNEVLVTVETRAVPVVVSGAVQHPGKIVFERPATLLEAIMEAGGFTPQADLKKVSVIRIVKGEHQTELFDLRPVLRGQATRATYVSGGDVIYVPERLLNF
jgi:polysaccharide export outer membrane protein